MRKSPVKSTKRKSQDRRSHGLRIRITRFGFLMALHRFAPSSSLTIEPPVSTCSFAMLNGALWQCERVRESCIVSSRPRRFRKRIRRIHVAGLPSVRGRAEPARAGECAHGSLGSLDGWAGRSGFRAFCPPPGFGLSHCSSGLPKS